MKRYVTIGLPDFLCTQVFIKNAITILPFFLLWSLKLHILNFCKTSSLSRLWLIFDNKLVFGYYSVFFFVFQVHWFILEVSYRGVRIVNEVFRLYFGVKKEWHANSKLTRKMLLKKLNILHFNLVIYLLCKAQCKSCIQIIVH